MKGARARHGVWTAAAVAAALLVASAAGQPPGDGAGWGPLAPELSSVLEAKAAGYARRALLFTCREKVRQAKYAGDEARKDKLTESDYLLTRAADALEGFRALRTKPGEPDSKGENVDLPFPEPYFWSALFDPRVRSLLHYQVGDWRTTPWRLAIPIQWVSSAPVMDHQRITEWSGVVEVEYGTGNLVRVVARPSLQDERLAPQLERYLTAFRFLGIPTVAPPTGLELSVAFDFEHEGFTYPTRVELITFRQVHRDVRRTVSRQVVEYTDYRFFGAEVEDHIPPLVWRPPAGDAGPGGP